MSVHGIASEKNYTTYLVTGLLGRSVHLLKDLLGESLLNLPEVDIEASLLDTASLSLGESLDVSIHGVLMAVSRCCDASDEACVDCGKPEEGLT